jgi:hypothetical protein
MSAHASKGIRFGPKMPPLVGHPPSFHTKSEKQTRTPSQEFISSFVAAFGGERTGRSGRKEALRQGRGASGGA